MQPAFKSFRQIVKTLLSYVLSSDIWELKIVSTHFKGVLPACHFFLQKIIIFKKPKYFFNLNQKKGR